MACLRVPASNVALITSFVYIAFCVSLNLILFTCNHLNIKFAFVKKKFPWLWSSLYCSSWNVPFQTEAVKSTLNRVVLADYDLPRQVSLNIGRLPLFLFGVLQALFSYTCVSFKQSGLNCIMLLGNNCAQWGGNRKKNNEGEIEKKMRGKKWGGNRKKMRGNRKKK